MEGVKETLERLVNEKNSLVKAMERKKPRKPETSRRLKLCRKKMKVLIN